MDWITREQNGTTWIEAFIHPHPESLSLSDQNRCYIYVQIVTTPAGKAYWHARGWGAALSDDAEDFGAAKKAVESELRKLLENAHDEKTPINWEDKTSKDGQVMVSEGHALDGFLQAHITKRPSGYLADMRGWADAMSITEDTIEKARKKAEDEFQSLVKQLRKKV